MHNDVVAAIGLLDARGGCGHLARGARLLRTKTVKVLEGLLDAAVARVDVRIPAALVAPG